MFSNWERSVGLFDEEERTDDAEFYDGPGSWYGSTVEGEGEGEDEDEFDDSDNE